MLDILPNPWCALTYVVLKEDLFDITTNNVKTIFRVCLVYVCVRICTCVGTCVSMWVHLHICPHECGDLRLAWYVFFSLS